MVLANKSITTEEY